MAYQKMSDRMMSNEYAIRYIRHVSTKVHNIAKCFTQRSLTTTTPRVEPILLSLYAVLARPLRNLRELRLGMPRADKVFSDYAETNDHENSIRHCRRLHVSMVLHQDRLRRERQMLTRLHRRLCAFSITRERLVDIDKEYGVKRWCTRRDKFLDFNPNSRLQQDGRLSRMLCTFLVDVGD
uniref:Uncharacterized protein n=1 Tax=Oryza sativa subsp. japonica TaxID=39947 RepID=Q6ZCE3_ORYSJ|nr:hypothetical protein [Oryza sativa Japonica Group]